jgi:hypothetical protein
MTYFLTKVLQELSFQNGKYFGVIHPLNDFRFLTNQIARVLVLECEFVSLFVVAFWAENSDSYLCPISKDYAFQQRAKSYSVFHCLGDLLFVNVHSSDVDTPRVSCILAEFSNLAIRQFGIPCIQAPDSHSKECFDIYIRPLKFIDFKTGGWPLMFTRSNDAFSFCKPIDCLVQIAFNLVDRQCCFILSPSFVHILSIHLRMLLVRTYALALRQCEFFLLCYQIPNLFSIPATWGEYL